MNILLVDNYDSFTFNLQHYLKTFHTEVTVLRNDHPDILNLNIAGYNGIVISPGPGKPAEAGLLPAFINQTIRQVPVLGVCLGYQAIGEFFGAKLEQSGNPKQGKISPVKHNGHCMFTNIPSEFKATRYHSLVLNKLPSALIQTAFTHEKELMAFAHKDLPVWGVQYHPEAILSGFGYQIINNWLQLCRHKNSF